jgi:hypothetical protein
MDYRTQLLALAKALAEHRNVSTARVATQCANHGAFFSRLNAGATCTVDRYLQIKQWFSDHWPINLVWPLGVDRPGILPVQTDIAASTLASTPNDAKSSISVPPPAALDLPSGGTCGPSCPSVGGAGRLSGAGE